MVAEVCNVKSLLRLPGYIVQGMGCFRSLVHLLRFGDYFSHPLRLFGTLMYAGTQARRAFTTATSNIPQESHCTIRVDAGRFLERSRSSPSPLPTRLPMLDDHLVRPLYRPSTPFRTDASTMNQMFPESPPTQPLRSVRRGPHPL